jgi:aminoglycoside phosphotransferase (APT) family kinase protein
VPRVRPAKEAENIAYEHKVIEFVNKNVVKTGQPLKTEAGKKILELNGKAVCFYEKIEGTHYDNSDTELFAAVDTVAKLHSAGKEYVEKRKQYLFRGNFDELKNIKRANSGIIRKAIARVKERKVPWDELDESLTHGDLHPGNIVFADGKVAGMLDLEVANVASTATDLVWMLRTFTSKKGWQQTGAFDISRLEEARKRYENNYKTDFEYLPELLLGHYLSYIDELIKQSREIQENIIQIKWILQNYK